MGRWQRVCGALVALALMGCGAGSGAPGPPAPAEAGAPASPAGAGSTEAAPPAPVALRFGLNTPGASVAPVWVAHEEGFFAQHGIDAELTPIAGGERIVTALITGDVPVSILAGTAMLTAALGGADLKYYGSFNNRLRYWLYARPENQSVQDLRGKPLAISGRGGINRRGLELVLERHGLDPERDVTLIAMGQSSEALVALLNGAVAATVLTPPAIFRAEDEGMRLLADTQDYNYFTVLSGVAATRAWVAQHEAVMRRALRALAEALAFTHREPERTKAVIAKWTQVDDPVLLERTYVASLPGWERDLRVPLEAIRTELDVLASELPAARTARPEQFVDNRFADELARAGLFEGP